MGFDDWGPTRKPRPVKPKSPEQTTADLDRRQRADDRRMPGAGTNSRAKDFGTFAIDSTLVLDGSGYGSSTWTLPTSHARYGLIASALIAADDGDECFGDLSDGGSGSSTAAAYAVGRSGGSETGFTCHIVTTRGATVTFGIISTPAAAVTVQFSCYPLAG